MGVYALVKTFNTEINQLYITESTVKTHLTSVYTKTGIDNKVQFLNAVLEG